MQNPYPNYSGLYRSVLGLVFAQMTELNSTVQLTLPVNPVGSGYDFEMVRIPRWTRERSPRENTTFDASLGCWSDGHETLWVCKIPSDNAVALQLRRQAVRWHNIKVQPMRWRIDRDGEVRISVAYSPRSSAPIHSKDWEMMMEYARQIGSVSIQTDPREASISLDLTVDSLDIRDAIWPEDDV